MIKNLLRLQLREKMKQLKFPLEEPYRRLVIEYLNIVFGESEGSDEHWNTVLKENAKKFYVCCLTKEELSNEFHTKSILTSFSSPEMDGKYLLFHRIKTMTGLKFSSQVLKELRENPNCWAPRGEKPFDESDLEEVGLRVKHMNIINHAQGYIFKTKADEKFSRDPLASTRLFKMAIQKFEEALDCDPHNPETLCNLAETIVRLLECEGRHVLGLQLDRNDRRVRIAEAYFVRAFKSAPSDSNILSQYARFLEKCGLTTQAEEFYLRALEADPNNDSCLHEYGNFLHERGLYELSEKFLLRCGDITNLDEKTKKRKASNNTSTTIVISGMGAMGGMFGSLLSPQLSPEEDNLDKKKKKRKTKSVFFENEKKKHK